LRFAPACLELKRIAAFEAWLSYTCSESCWRTSTEKNTCGIARFPCGSTAFLLFVVLYWPCVRLCVRMPAYGFLCMWFCVWADLP